MLSRPDPLPFLKRMWLRQTSLSYESLATDLQTYYSITYDSSFHFGSSLLLVTSNIDRHDTRVRLPIDGRGSPNGWQTKEFQLAAFSAKVLLSLASKAVSCSFSLYANRSGIPASILL